MIHREAPICTGCNKPLPPIFKDQNHLPTEQRIIGDTFIDWDYKSHSNCREALTPEGKAYYKAMIEHIGKCIQASFDALADIPVPPEKYQTEEDKCRIQEALSKIVYPEFKLPEFRLEK